MRSNRYAAGHLAALLTILIWGTTFISTKVLLCSFQPVETCFFAFCSVWLHLCSSIHAASKAPPGSRS